MDPNRLTEKAQDAVRQAQSTAQRQGHSQIEAEHLAVGLLEQEGGVASRVLEKAGVSPATLPDEVARERAEETWRWMARRLERW
jgi:ATP-dependent Clp protease ATP-binding subunit ClpB